MGHKLSPWTTRAIQMLMRAPVSWTRLFENLVLLVPPGRAARQHQGNLQRMRPDSTHRNKVTPELARTYGARDIINQSLQSLKTRGQIEWFEKNGERWVRLTEKGRMFYTLYYPTETVSDDET